MEISTINSGSGLCTFTIMVNGTAIPSDVSVYAITVGKHVNRIASATIQMLDGSPGSGTFALSSSSIFLPGAQISVAAGYDNNDTVIFSGVITGQSLKIDSVVGAMLEVTCKDKAVKTVVARKNRMYSDVKASDIITAIASEYNGLQAVVSDTGRVLQQQIQYYVTDWDFMLSLADANGMVVTTLNNVLSVFRPQDVQTSVLTVSYGAGLMEFDADLNAIAQLDQVSATAWDYTSQSEVSSNAGNAYAGPGNLSPAQLAKVLNIEDYTLQTNAALGNSDLTEWAKARILKNEFSKIQGSAKFQGTGVVEPGKYITIGGVGDRFNGDYFVAGVTQRISDGNWITEVNLGLPLAWSNASPDVVAPSASGLVPGVRGIYTGVVQQVTGDPDGQYRVLVHLPMFESMPAGVWARLANFYASGGAGALFMPEVGEEVVLGFVNEDPRYPVVLGSMYSSPAHQPSSMLQGGDANSFKGITSKNGITIRFDDNKKELLLQTPGNNSLTISDDSRQIAIKDQNGNSITLSAEGITISSVSDINMKAAGKISFTGDAGIKMVTSGGDVAVSGVNIKHEASMQYTASGSAMATMAAGGELKLEAAMIMIN